MGEQTAGSTRPAKPSQKQHQHSRDAHTRRPRPRRTCTKSACEGSCGSKLSAVGKRLGADQKGAPVEVVASSGNVNVSWAILWGGGWRVGGLGWRMRGWVVWWEFGVCVWGGVDRRLKRAASRAAVQCSKHPNPDPTLINQPTPSAHTHPTHAPVVEVVIELEARPADAAAEVGHALTHQDLHHARQLLARGRVCTGADGIHVPGGVVWMCGWGVGVGG